MNVSFSCKYKDVRDVLIFFFFKLRRHFWEENRKTYVNMKIYICEKSKITLTCRHRYPQLYLLSVEAMWLQGEAHCNKKIKNNSTQFNMHQFFSTFLDYLDNEGKQIT